MLTPLEIGLGTYMGGFYADLVADTPAMEEFIKRGLAKSIVWVPGRMVDNVVAMLAEWRKNDNERDGRAPAGKPGLSSRLPVMFIGMSKDFVPALGDFGPAVGTAIDVASPDDPFGRMYRMRVSVNEYRAQVVIIAPEAPTAHSLAMQFNLWASGPDGRRFKHWHEYAGERHEFAAVLSEIDLGAVDAKPEQTNLTILIADLNIRASIPIFQAPKAAEANDGKPAPAGYPVVTGVDGQTADGVTWGVR